jgi:hypothetical protein
MILNLRWTGGVVPEKCKTFRNRRRRILCVRRRELGCQQNGLLQTVSGNCEAL